MQPGVRRASSRWSDEAAGQGQAADTCASVRAFCNSTRPRPRATRPGLLLVSKTVLGGPLVADVDPAEAGHPTPAAGSDHHDAAEAAAPVAVAPVMAATHATALAAAGGSFGRDERDGADGDDGGDSENRLADHGSLLVFVGCVLTSCLSVGRAIRRVQWRLDKKRAPDPRGKGRPRIRSRAAVVFGPVGAGAPPLVAVWLVPESRARSPASSSRLAALAHGRYKPPRSALLRFPP